MMSIQAALAPILGQVPPWVLLLALLVVSLALIFAGSEIVKVIAFLIVGVAGASVGAVLAAQYLPPGGDLVGIILGFVMGGLLGVALIPLAIGILVGYAGYLLALDFALSFTMALVAGVVFFVVGLALSGKILTVATAIAGGLLLFNTLTLVGFTTPLSMVLAAAVTVAGIWVQLAPERRVTKAPTPTTGGQPK